MIKNVGAPAISIIVTLGFLAVLVLFLLRPVAIPEAAAPVLNILVGTLAAKFGDVVGYWIGSSSSSHAKDEVIANLKAPQ